MFARLFWTDEAEQHIARHGLTKAEVEDALRGFSYVRSANGRYVVIARGSARPLLVVIEPLKGRRGLAAVVTARPATFAEKRLLRRRGKWHR